MEVTINGEIVRVMHNPFNILWRTKIRNTAEGLDGKLQSGQMCEEEGKDFIETFFSNESGGYSEEAVPVCLKVAEHFRDAGEDKRYWSRAISDLRNWQRNTVCRICTNMIVNRMEGDLEGLLKEYAVTEDPELVEDALKDVPALIEFMGEKLGKNPGVPQIVFCKFIKKLQEKLPNVQASDKEKDNLSFVLEFLFEDATS